MERERQVEQHLVNQCKKLGYQCIKFTSPGTRFLPDRIIIAPLLIAFVECKATNGVLKEGQKRMLAKLQSQGHIAVVLDSRSKVDTFLHVLGNLANENIIEATNEDSTITTDIQRFIKGLERVRDKRKAEIAEQNTEH